MNMTLEKLGELISCSVDAGVQAYMKSIEPARDEIKQGEAKRLIKKYGYKPAALEKWVAARLLLPVKTGNRNSAVWYSLAEIKRVIATLKLKEIDNDDIESLILKNRI